MTFLNLINYSNFTGYKGSDKGRILFEWFIWRPKGYTYIRDMGWLNTYSWKSRN
ncbi:MAG: hypothetical protein ACTHK8_18615 [Ginsengibacter sp.]